MKSNYTNLEKTAQEYYNSGDADHFYSHIWGGEDIHIGLYQSQNDSIFEASKRTVEKKIQVTDGSFEFIPFEDSSFDLVWSQDAILHSGNRIRVIQEVRRILKQGGIFIFTDPMQKEGVDTVSLLPVLERIHLNSLGSFKFYAKACLENGLKKSEMIDITDQLVNHYSSVNNEIVKRYDEMTAIVNSDYLDRMKIGLGHWIDILTVIATLFGLATSLGLGIIGGGSSYTLQTAAISTGLPFVARARGVCNKDRGMSPCKLPSVTAAEKHFSSMKNSGQNSIQAFSGAAGASG